MTAKYSYYRTCPSLTRGWYVKATILDKKDDKTTLIEIISIKDFLSIVPTMSNLTSINNQLHIETVTGFKPCISKIIFDQQLQKEVLLITPS